MLDRFQRALRESGIVLGDLLPLADPSVQDAGDRLQKVYEWYFERTMTLARLAFASAGAVLIALVTATLQDDDPSTSQFIVLIGSVLLFLGLGASLMLRLKNLTREYSRTLRLLSRYERLLELIARARP